MVARRATASEVPLLRSLNSESAKHWRVWLSAYAPILLWVGVIFYLSSDNGSSVQTSRFIRPLLEFLFPGAPPTTIDLYHFYIRKAAHFTEYAILSLVLARAFIKVRAGFRYWPFAAVGIVALVAAGDEINQSLEASRTASPYDSLLDIVGGSVAAFVLWLLLKRASTRQQPPVEQAQG